MKTNLFFLMALLAALLVCCSPAQAFDCMSFPITNKLIKQGEGCGGAIPCERGFYCDKTGVCAPKKGTGETCESGVACPDFHVCSGTPQKCLKNLNPGENCNENVTAAYCGGELHCDDVCQNARLGDGCKTDTDCQSGRCEGKVCKIASDIGDLCDSNFGCGGSSRQQWCKGDACVAGKTSGNCTVEAECAPGYHCILPTFKNYEDGEEEGKCVKRRALGAGKWCHSFNEVCAKGICHRGRCIEKSPVRACESCIIGEICTCNDGFRNDGNGGTCKEDKCAVQFSAFWDCTNTKCESSDRSYSQSCANRLCKAEWEAYTNCDPENLLNLVFS